MYLTTTLEAGGGPREMVQDVDELQAASCTILCNILIGEKLK